MRSALVLLALAAALPARAQDARLAGTYTLDAAASEDLGQAVRRTVARTNPLLRGYVARRLRTANPPIPRVVIVLEGTAALITTGPDTRRNTIGGPGVRATDPDGKPYVTTVAWNGPRLVQRFTADEGVRTNTFSLDEQGRLVLNVRVESDRLAAPLTYALVYRRQ